MISILILCESIWKISHLRSAVSAGRDTQRMEYYWGSLRKYHGFLVLSELWSTKTTLKYKFSRIVSS